MTLYLHFDAVENQPSKSEKNDKNFITAKKPDAVASTV